MCIISLNAVWKQRKMRVGASDDDNDDDSCMADGLLLAVIESVVDLRGLRMTITLSITERVSVN